MVLAVIALCGIFLVVGQSRAATMVPDFSLPAVLQDKPVDIKDYRGKVLLITFWATWCGPCVQEIPSLVSLQQEYGPRGFSVIGISLDQGGPAVVEKMMKKTGINYPVAMGNSRVSKDFGGIFGIPVSFLVDQSGQVVKRYNGWVSHKVLDEAIQEILR